jgi:hypothetical protein
MSRMTTRAAAALAAHCLALAAPVAKAVPRAGETASVAPGWVMEVFGRVATLVGWADAPASEGSRSRFDKEGSCPDPLGCPASDLNLKRSGPESAGPHLTQQD